MKVVYLHQFFKFPADTGGTRSYDLAASFDRNGIDVEVITTSASISSIKFENGWNFLERDGLKIHVLSLQYNNQMSYFNRSLVFIKFLWYSTFKLLSLKADVVLATSTPLTIGIPALIKKWWHNTPFIFEVRDVWPEAVIAIGAIKNKIAQKLLYSLEKLLYKNAAAIVPLSTDMKRSIVSRYPQLSNKPIEVIENISEIDRFQNNVNPSRSYIAEKIGFAPRFTILYGGTFGRVNGIDYVIRLAEQLMPIDPTIVFILIGNGSEKEKVQQLAKEKGVLDKNVFFLDAVAKNGLSQLYYEVNMGSSFVINIEELWANSANKFFDTLAAGRPVLINYGGWQSRMIDESNTGYTLSPQINRDMACKFVEYTRDTELQRLQQKNSLSKAMESYSLEVAVNKYLKVFENII